MFDRRTDIKSFFFLLLAVMLNGFAAQAQGSGTPEKMDSLQLVLKNAKTNAERASALVQLGEACNVQDNMKYALPLVEIIEKELPKTKDRESITTLLDQRSRAVEFITFYYRVTKKANPQSIVDEYLKQIDLCKKYGYYEGAANTLYRLSNGYQAMGKPLERLNSLKEAYDLMKKYGRQKAQSKAILELGFFYAEYGDTSKAVAYLREGQEMEKKIGDSTRISRGHFIIGKFYASIEWYEKALEHFAQAETRYKRGADTNQLLQVYYQTANVYLELKNSEKALEYYQACHDMAIAYKANEILDASTIGIGDAFFQQKKYKEAISLHQSIYDRYKQTGFDGLLFVTIHLAADYAQLKDYAKARPLAYQALDLVYKTDYAPEIMRTERMVYQLDSAAGDYKSAFEHYQKYLSYKKMNYDQSVQKASVQEKFQNDLAEQKNKSLQEQQRREVINAEEKRKQKYILYTVSIVLFFVIALVVFIFRGYKQKQKANKELAAKNETIAQQKHLVEAKQKEVMESISYAKYLQEAILPPQQFIDENIPENFILYKPKDIVAGDFYWAEKMGDLFFIAAADSTGHGVPGAMVSVVCSNALNRTVKEFRLLDPGKILDKTRDLVLETFEKSKNQVKDGMDISLACINLQNKTITWSGANNSLWYIRNNELREIKADKQPIGKTDHPQPFSSHQLENGSSTTLYLFTDGYADQFGGPKGKKLKYKSMEEKLTAIHALPMSEQKHIMNQAIEDWMGDLEQNDDICLIGVKI